MRNVSTFFSLISTPKTFLLSLVFFLLPWQTHLLVSEGMILGSGISPFTSVKLYAVEVFVVLAALAAVVIKKDRPIIDAPYRLPIALACLVAVITTLSTMWSGAPTVTLGALLHVGSAMVLFVLMLDKKLPLKPLLFAFGMGLVIPACIGIGQIMFDASPSSTVLGMATRDAATLGDAVTVHDGVRELRAYGSFPHPNVFGGYLAVGALALVALAKNEKTKTKKVLLAVALLLTIALVLTGSRSAILGLLLGIGLAGLVRRMKDTAKARIAVIPIAGVVIAGAFLSSLFAPNIVAGIRGGGVTEDHSLMERMIQYANYPRIVADDLALGGGLGTYVIEAAEVEPGLEVWAYQPIHNVPLLIIGEIGLIGALIVFAWSSSIDRINFARFPNRDALVAFAMGNVVLVILFFDHYIWSSWPGLALIALVMALTVRMGEE